MAEDDKKFKVTDANVTVTLQEVKPPVVTAKPDPTPNYLATILFVALIFETILIATFAFGRGDAAAAGRAVRIWLPEIRASIRSATNRVLVRERNAALRRAQTAASESDERSWRLVSKILDQVKDEIADRIEKEIEQSLSVKSTGEGPDLAEPAHDLVCPAGRRLIGCH